MRNFGAVLLSAMLLACPCWPQRNPCLPGLAEPLRAKALSAIESIVRRDSESVLNSLAKEGLLIGDDSPMPLASVRRQFADKNGLFCLFFDSECMTEPSNRSLWSGDRVLSALSRSYHDWLRGGGKLKLEINFMDAPVTKYCGASVFVYPQNASAPTNIEFGFVYRGGSWALNHVGDMP